MGLDYSHVTSDVTRLQSCDIDYSHVTRGL